MAILRDRNCQACRDAGKPIIGIRQTNGELVERLLNLAKVVHYAIPMPCYLGSSVEKSCTSSGQFRVLRRLYVVQDMGKHFRLALRSVPRHALEHGLLPLASE